MANISKTDLVKELAETTGLGQKDVKTVVDAMLERYGIRVLPTYGATEFAGAIALWTAPMHAKYWPAKAGSAGRPVPGVERLRSSR